jgi:LacI family transcriptional regulator
MTQSDIATLVGVDKSSVSLALRGDPRISPETRHRIIKAASRCHYRMNLAARQLAGSRTQVLGLVLPRMFETLNEPVVVRTLQVLAKLAKENGYLFTILPDVSPPPGAPPHEESYPMLVDGALIWGDVPLDHVDQLAAHGLSVLVLDPSHPSYAACGDPVVRIDNASGATQVVGHLIKRDVQRLLFVRVVRDHLGHDQRWNVAREQWLRHRPVESLSYCLIEELTEVALRQFVERPGGAIFASNDTGALRIWRRLMVMGVSIPDRVRLAGFDGLPAAREVHLTTVLFDCDRLAHTAFDAMAALLKSETVPPERLVIPCTLDVGGTA